MNLHLTYFGDNNFSLGKKRIRKQAENFEVFSSIKEYGEDDLKNNSFWDNSVQHMMQERIGVPGKFYGYYACKPYFVEKAIGVSINFKSSDLNITIWKTLKKDCGFTGNFHPATSTDLRSWSR